MKASTKQMSLFQSLTPEQLLLRQVYAVAAGSSVSCSSASHPNYRLDHNIHTYQCWMPAAHILGQWIQASQEQPKLWSGLILQGRGDADDWVKQIKVDYTLNGKIWQSVEEKVFTANNDRNTKKYIKFSQPVYARALRIYPQSWQGNIALRFEAIYIDFDLTQII